MKLTEPAADLAIALAVASAAADRPIAHDTVAVGEISLAGEVRPVSMSAERVSEAARMGFTTVLDSRKGSAHAALVSALR